MFHICTIANDLGQYRAMRDSFVRAGFGEGVCRYTLLDNSAGNAHEPYSALSRALEGTAEPYLIFCHQDIRLDRGDGYEALTRAIRDLDGRDPRWAVAGNAGGTDALLVVMRITDPAGVLNSGDFPEKVQTLDENFLLIKSGVPVRTSPELSGFHLYGTDLCFHAIRQHYTCYVIDFHLTHLSAGDFQGDDFRASVAQFSRHWNRAFVLCLVKTTGALFPLSRFAGVRALLRSEKRREWLLQHRGIYARAGRIVHGLRKGQIRQLRDAYVR